MTSSSRAMILGCGGPRLSVEEKQFFRAVQPWGFILFGRNIESLEQVKMLTGEMREAVGWQAPVLVDQEGGTVRRLRPPLVRDYPPAARIAALYAASPEAAREAAWISGRLMAGDLLPLGINVDCAPVLDIPPAPGAGFLADRTFGCDPDQVIAMAQAQADGLKAGGVLPVVKHMPGHGRGLLDSHKRLPVVDAPLALLRDRDFRPFREVTGIAMAMTCHVLFEAVDPDNPASASKKLVEEVMRGEIGFDGLIISDDISMNALSGDIATRARAVADAGLDIILHCNGDMPEMRAVAGQAPQLAGDALTRATTALASAPEADDSDLKALSRRFDALMDEKG
ncbi:beta-N-acetylhexosaminidase [Martelella mangrovi]|uniref:beta-N-acetylhexosaminidase n=1 Tax=Martelella mangrovi TaxID=1397477 RepID=A0ABV2IFF7_9HYPH